MPYSRLTDLPDAVRELPEGGQRIYLAAFNSALAQYRDEGKAHATAWAAVKHKYEKGPDGTWRAKESAGDAIMPGDDGGGEKPYLREVQVHELFPAGSVMPLGDGDYRIEFLAHGHTRDNARYYPKETLERAVSEGVFDGAKMFIGHSDPRDVAGRGHRDLRDWAATLKRGTLQVVEGNIQAVCHAHSPEARAFLDDPVAKSEVGLSHDSMVKVYERRIDGRDVQVVEAITRCNSVDFVPLGNAFGRVIESAPGTEVSDMDITKLTWEELSEARPDLATAAEERAREAAKAETEKAIKEAKEQAVKEALAERDKAQEPPTDNAAPDVDAKITEALKPVQERTDTLANENAALRRELDERNTAEIVGSMVRSDTRLTEASKAHVIDAFAGQAIPAKDIPERVKAACDKQASLEVALLRESGVASRVTGLGAADPTDEGAKERREAYEVGFVRRCREAGMSEDQIKALQEVAK